MKFSPEKCLVLTHRVTQQPLGVAVAWSRLIPAKLIFRFIMIAQDLEYVDRRQVRIEDLLAY